MFYCMFYITYDRSFIELTKAIDGHTFLSERIQSHFTVLSPEAVRTNSRGIERLHFLSCLLSRPLKV